VKGILGFLFVHTGTHQESSRSRTTSVLFL
jgi:hypothetical protein